MQDVQHVDENEEVGGGNSNIPSGPQWSTIRVHEALLPRLLWEQSGGYER